MTWRLLAALLLLVRLSAPLQAQTTDSPSIEMEVTVGLDGWIDQSGPVPVAVTIRSELLFSGTLQLRSGRSIVEVSTEVPAGSEKTYSLMLSPIITDALMTVRLLPAGQTESISTVRVQPQQAVDTVLVGALGVTRLDLPARTVVGDVPIVEVPIDDLTAGLDPLDYLVMADIVAATDELFTWVEEGGHLVVSSRRTTELGLDAGVEMDGINGSRFEVGNGEVLAVEDLLQPEADWTRAIQPVRALSSMSDPWATAEIQMVRAASNSVPRALASPVILIALGIYAIVVAPVNLIVLRRMRRRELAWITVPAFGILAVLALVILGVMRPQSSQFAQAALVVGSPEGPELRSVVVVASSTERVHRLSVDSGSILYPAATGDSLGLGATAADRIVVSPNEVALEFHQAGYGTAGVIGPAPTLPRLSISATEETPVLQVENDTRFRLTAYGVVTGPFVSVALGELEEGAVGSVRISADNFGTAPEVVAQTLQVWSNSRWWEVYGPLSSSAQQQVGDQYFFGFVDNLPVPVEVDGRSREINGPGMIVIPLASYKLDIGRASPQLVAASPNSFVSGEGPWRWVEGEWAILRFQVPTDRPIQLQESSDMFGDMSSVLEGWDWEASAFALIELGEVDRDRFVDGDGQMLVRMLPEIENEFVSMQFNIGSVNVTWDTRLR